MRLERLRWLWTQCDLFDARDQRSSQATAPPEWQPTGKPFDLGRAVEPQESGTQRTQRTQRTHRDDAAFVDRLGRAHAEYNERLFGRRLAIVQIRISRRMKNRLGHYMAAGHGMAAEIALSRKHIERDPWDDVLHTLVHEMVHQWQDENGHALDHGQSFRRKAREVGISARATRPAEPRSQPRLAARAMQRGES